MDSILQKISKDLHPEQSVLPNTEVLGSAVALLQADEIDGLLVMIEAGKQLLFMRLENGKERKSHKRYLLEVPLSYH